MNNDMMKGQFTDDEYNGEYDDGYNDDYDDYDESDDYEEDDDSSSGGGKHGGSGKLFIIVLFLMAAIGGTYFGLRFLNVDIMKSFSIESILKGSSQDTASSAQSGQSSSEAAQSGEETEENTQNTENTENTDAQSSQDTSESEEVQNNTVKESEIKITFENDSRSKFLYFDDGYLYLTKDGAKYYLDLDTQKWNDTYTMSSVTGISNGKYAIINDVQGKNLRLYSTDGLAFSAQTDGNIVSCALNSQGTSAVIQKYGEDYKISVIRNDGQILMERFEQDSGIYPLSAALSEDSRILAVTYADTSDIEIKAKVLLFYVNKEDSKNTATGEFYAGIEKEDIIAPYIFALDGKFVIVYDKGLFAVDANGNEVWNTPISNRIDAVAVTQNGNIVLALGEQLAGSEGFENGTVYILNKNGKEKSEYLVGDDISYLNVAGKDIIIGSGNDFICINESAKENWHFTATQVIKDVFPYTGGNKVLVITGSEAKIIEAE